MFSAGSLTRTFYSDDGSTAVEVAVKMAVQYWQLRGRPEKCRFVAFENAYHGDTTGAASLGGVDTFTNRFAAIHFPVERAANLDGVSSRSPDRLAAVIIEPLVQGAAGIRLWPPGMLSLCARGATRTMCCSSLTRFYRLWTYWTAFRLRARARPSGFSLPRQRSHRWLPSRWRQL